MCDSWRRLPSNGVNLFSSPSLLVYIGCCQCMMNYNTPMPLIGIELRAVCRNRIYHVRRHVDPAHPSYSALTLQTAKVLIVPHRITWSRYTGRWWVGCYIWYSDEGTGRGRSPPRHLLALPNVTAHTSTASVPITVSLYNGPLHCCFNARRVNSDQFVYDSVDYNETVGPIYTVSKSGPLQVMWHNFTKSQSQLSLIIFGRQKRHSPSSDYGKKFLNWLRTSCVVSITTVATNSYSVHIIIVDVAND